MELNQKRSRALECVSCSCIYLLLSRLTSVVLEQMSARGHVGCWRADVFLCAGARAKGSNCICVYLMAPRKCSANQQTLTQLQSRPSPIDTNYFRCLYMPWPVFILYHSDWRRIIQITCIICFNNFHQSSLACRGVRCGFSLLVFRLWLFTRAFYLFCCSALGLPGVYLCLVCGTAFRGS